MRYGIAFLSLILVLFVAPSWARDTVITNFVCLHKEVVENYIDIIEAEGGLDAATKMIRKDIASGECMKFPEIKFPVESRGTVRVPVMFKNKQEFSITLVQIKKYWGIELVPVESS